MIGAVLTAGKFGYAAFAGVDAFVDATAQYVVKLALRSRRVDHDAADEMVGLMRSRVPVDSGRLLNGITAREDGDAWIVEASAVRAEFDYARAVEFGHVVGHADPLGPPRARRSRAEHGGRADPEPFFLGSGEEVLRKRGRAMEEATVAAAREAGL